MKIKEISSNFSPWKSGIATTLSIASTITAVALKSINPLNVGKNFITGTLLSFVAGAGFQNTFQVLLPKKWAEKEKAFLANYATAIFLIISQIYRNIIPTEADKEGVFAILTALGGGAVATFVHSLATRKSDELIKGLPLDTVSIGNEDDSQTLNAKNIKIVGLNRRKSRMIFYLAKGILATAAITVGATIGKGSLLRDFGIILLGDAFMQITSEMGIAWYKSYQESENISPLFSKSKGLHRYRTFMKVFLSLAWALPGMTIVFGRFCEKVKLPALSVIGYLLTGVLDGGKRNYDLNRFSDIPTMHLKEFEKIQNKEQLSLLESSEKKPLSSWKKTSLIAKWAFAIFGIGGFLALGIAGLNPQTGKFTSVPPFDRSALAVFAIALYGGYAVAEFVKRKFREKGLGNSSSWINSAYFYMHYSQGIPLLALYIMEKMEIGDEALAKDPVLQGVLGCIAYGSLGLGLSLEKNTQGEFSQPTASIPSSLTMALIFRFIAHELTNQI